MIDRDKVLVPLREFMEIEGEMKRVMDDPEYGKEYGKDEEL